MNAVRRDGFPFAFACRRSGNCCAVPGGVVRVTPAEAAAIATQLGMTEVAFVQRFVQPDGATLKEGMGNRCVFLQDGAEAACAIYAARPRACREWPFWEQLRDDPAAVAAAARRCPGITLDALPEP